MRLVDWLAAHPAETKTKLSKALDVRWQTVHEWVQGTSAPRLEHAVEIERYTAGAVTVADLVSGAPATGDEAAQ